MPISVSVIFHFLKYYYYYHVFIILNIKCWDLKTVVYTATNKSMCHSIIFFFRLYSHYYHRCSMTNHLECDEHSFHDSVIEAIRTFNICTANRSARECAYDTCLNILGYKERLVSV